MTIKMLSRLCGAAAGLLAVACTSPDRPASQGQASPAAAASTAPKPSPLAPVVLPEAPGASGSIVANGRTVDIRHVYSRKEPDPIHPMSYQVSGGSLDELQWVGNVVKGRHTDDGEYGSARFPWSYAVAFHVVLNERPTSKGAAKKR